MTSFASSAASRTLWTRVKSIPMAYPFAFGVVLSGFKTSFSDLLVQKVVEQRETIDWKRNAAFASFGFFYLGGVQYMIYVPLFSRLFPGAAAFAAKPIREKLKDSKGLFQVSVSDWKYFYYRSTLFSRNNLTSFIYATAVCSSVPRSMRAVRSQIDATLSFLGLTQSLHRFVLFFSHPLMYFPAFYCTRELVMKEKPDLARTLATYRANLQEDLLALWKVWVPGTLINFAFMPMYARIPFVACISLLWTCILSTMRGGDVAHGEDMAGGAVTRATLVMMEEGLGELFTSPVELDRHKDHIMLTASGIDKKGWVALLAREIAESGGNVTHSKMVRLGKEFIVLMHVSVEPGEQSTLIKRLKKNKELKPMNIQCGSISRRQTGTYEQAVMGVRVRCQGADK